YSTYLGGASNDYGRDIAVDSSEYVYVTGYTLSTDFPTLDQYQSDQGVRDVFITKIDTTRSGAASLLYSTYLGGAHLDYGKNIAVDSSGYVYVTGHTDSTDFPTLDQYQSDQGGRDVFITKVDTTQSAAASLLYSTYLGGSNSDSGSGIAVDSSGYVYVTGNTFSTDFPTLDQYQANRGSIDVFVTKLNPYPPLAVPIVTTRQVSSITSTSAVCGGKVTSDGGAAVLYRGVCWNKTGNPTTGDINTVDGNGTGSFTSYITELTPNTTYYVVAYAKNSVGTSYGKIREFKTLNNPSISGTITSSSSAIPDVALTFSNSGGTTTTNQDGYYNHTVEKNWSGTVTPSKTGYAFNPAQRTYNTVTSDRGSQDYTAYEINLSLNVSRETESAWIIKRQYGKIELEVNNPSGIAVAKYVIYRKETAGNYASIEEIPGSQLQGSTYLYYDKYLDKGKSYMYKFSAVDAQGVTIATSNEKTISAQNSASSTINRNNGNPFMGK
ncbi:MAG: SBBP repeat-containing protein, partial [Candidatus Aminicenantes bacterium]|nr:SBBP repeat-containing protein [Candidatus Aminicenantes bacterium]